MATLHSDSNISFKQSTFIVRLFELLSSAKLCVDTIEVNIKKLIKKKFIQVGLTIEPRGTTGVMFFFSYFLRYLFTLAVFYYLNMRK